MCWRWLPLFLLMAAVQAANHTSRHPRYLVYPPRGAYKLVAGLAIPMDSPKGKYIAWTINFQFQYALPVKIEDIQLPKVRRSLRAIDRPSIFSTLEEYLEGRGIPGRPCVRRMICEAAAHPMHHNGLVGRLLQIALTPSRGRYAEEVDPGYHEAEVLGQSGVHCRTVAPECPTDILGMVSEIHDEL